MNAIADLARLLTLFFSKYLMQQRQVSPNTIASYRDTFRLLLNYANTVLGKPPQDLSLGETRRRLGSVPSSIILSTSVGMTPAPAIPAWPQSGPCLPMSPCMSHAMRLWLSGSWRYRPSAIPDARSTSSIVRRSRLCWWRRIRQAGSGDVTIACCWCRCNRHAGLEIITLRRTDVRFGDGAHLRCHGKGRKERCIPLRRDSVAALDAWLKERGRAG